MEEIGKYALLSKSEEKGIPLGPGPLGSGPMVLGLVIPVCLCVYVGLDYSNNSLEMLLKDWLYDSQNEVIFNK